jgi:hypothetical protein
MDVNFDSSRMALFGVSGEDRHKSTTMDAAAADFAIAQLAGGQVLTLKRCGLFLQFY